MELKFIVLKNNIYQTKKDPCPVCSNSDYTAIFTFDKHWNGVSKTARFICYGNNKEPVEMFDVPIVDGKCKIPPINVAGKVTVGVFGGDIISTNTTCLTFVSSPLTTCAPQGKPSESVYNKIMSLFEKYYLRSAKIKENGELVFERGDGTRINAGSVDGVTVVGESVCSDWAEQDENAPSYIKNKPSLENEVKKDSESAVSSFAIYDELSKKLNSPKNEGVEGQALFYSAKGPHWSDIPHPERVVIDDELSETSKNPVENRVVAKAMNGIKGSECTVEGKDLSFSSEKAKFRGINIFGKTTQNGTPAPNSPIPLESVGKANLLDVTKVYVGGNTTLADGVVVQKSSDNKQNIVFKCLTYKDSSLISQTIATNYITSLGRYGTHFEKTAEVNRLVFGLNGSTIDTVVSADISYLPSGKYFLSVEFTNITQGSISWKDMMINEGTSVIQYRPYNNAQACVVTNIETENKAVQQLIAITPNGLCGVPVTDGGNYTDENGQSWICDEIDFERGVLIKRTKTQVFKGTEGFVALGGTDSNAFFYIIDPSMQPLTIDNSGFSLCSHFVRAVIGTTTTTVGHQVRKTSTGEQYRIVFRPENVAEMDAAAFQDWLKSNPTTVVYALAVPTEIPLSKKELENYDAVYTDLPRTTVTNDCGAQMKLKYLVRGAMPTNTELSDLLDDERHRLVSDEEKAAWNSKSSFSGSYNDLTNKPTIPSAYTLPTASETTKGGIIVGDGLMIDGNGVLSSDASSGIQCIDQTINMEKSGNSILAISVENPNLSYYTYFFHVRLRDQSGRDVSHIVSGAYIPNPDSNDVNAAHINTIKTRAASISSGLPTESTVMAYPPGIQCTYDLSDSTIDSMTAYVHGWYRVF